MALNEGSSIVDIYINHLVYHQMLFLVNLFIKFEIQWRITIWTMLLEVVRRSISLKNTEGVTKNGQSRETGNIRYTKHKTKINKAKNNTTQYVLDTTIRKQT